MDFLPTIPTSPPLAMDLTFLEDAQPGERASLLPPGPLPRRTGAIRRKSWHPTDSKRLPLQAIHPDVVELDSTPGSADRLIYDSSRPITDSPLSLSPDLDSDHEGFKEVVSVSISRARQPQIQNRVNPIRSTGRAALHVCTAHDTNLQQGCASAPLPPAEIATRAPFDDIRHPVYENGTPTVALELRKRLEEIIKDWGANTSPSSPPGPNGVSSDNWMVY